MSGSAVYITGRLGVPFLQRIKALFPDAVTRAIYRTKDELQQFMNDPSIVPFHSEGYFSGKYAGRHPGILQRSGKMFISPGQIAIWWSAIDPITGYDYAGIRDEEGGNQAPPGYSKSILKIAKELLMKNLVVELGAMQP